MPWFWKDLAVRYSSFNDCQRNPTIAKTVSLNLYRHLNISFFLGKVLKRVGSAWQKFWWLSKESKYSNECNFESSSLRYHSFSPCQEFKETWQRVAELIRVVNGIQTQQWLWVWIFISAWTFLSFWPIFWKDSAGRGRKNIDCQRNPTVAVNVSSNNYFHLDISTFPAKFLKSLGSARQKN